MNTVVTSKETILNVSRELIQKQGFPAVNIRAVAKACNISVGSIYNYFNSKTDLIAATVESVWCDIFRFPENMETFHSFTSCVEWIFDSIRKGDEKYPGFFTLHAMGFIGEDKSNGQKLMAQSWQHIQEHLHLVLTNDTQIRSEDFDENFTSEKFAEIIFSLIISALLQHNYDCSGILAMIRRVIY